MTCKCHAQYPTYGVPLLLFLRHRCLVSVSCGFYSFGRAIVEKDSFTSASKCGCAELAPHAQERIICWIMKAANLLRDGSSSTPLDAPMLRNYSMNLSYRF